MRTLLGQVESNRKAIALAKPTTLARTEVESQIARMRVQKFDCNPWQYEFLTDTTTPELMACGGIGSGKSWVLMRYAGMKMQRERGTGMVGGIFGNTYTQLTQAVLPHLWEFLENQLRLEYGKDYVYNEQPPRSWGKLQRFQDKFKKNHKGVLSVKRWGQAVVRSLENFESIRGIEIGWGVMDEVRDTRKRAFEVVLGRLRGWDHIELRATTSPNGYDWIFEEFVERVDLPKDDPKYLPPGQRKLIRMRTKDNLLGLDKNYYERLVVTYDSKYAAQELEGQFVSLTSGMCYWPFDRSKHTDPSIRPYDADWQISFDFNRTPFTVILHQTYGSGLNAIVKAVDEVVMMDSDTGNVCEEVFRRLKGYDTKGRIEVFGDPAGRVHHTSNNRSDYDVITDKFRKKYGQRFIRRWRTSDPGQMNRVNCLNAMIEHNRFFVSPRCKELRRDFERVKWIEGSKRIDKSDKSRTHGSDASAYFIAEQFPIHVGSGSMSI